MHIYKYFFNDIYKLQHSNQWINEYTILNQFEILVLLFHIRRNIRKR